MNVTCTACQTVFRVDPAKVPAAGVRARCSVCAGVFWVRHPAPVVVPTPTSTPAPVSPPVALPVKSEAPLIPAEATVSAPAPATVPVAPAVAPPRIEVAATLPPLLAPLPPIVLRPEGPAVAPPVRRPEPTEPLRLPPNLERPSGWPPLPPTSNPSPRPAPPAAPAMPSYAAPAASAVELPAAPAVKRPRGNPFLRQDPAAKARRLARALISDMVVYHPAKRREGLQNASLKRLFEEEIRKSWEEYVDQVGKDVAESTPFFHEALNEILAGGSPVFP